MKVASDYRSINLFEGTFDSCRSRIDFHGHYPTRKSWQLRNEHLFTIVASQFEILPYAVLEAMALGCPIIASNVGGIPELITDQKTGPTLYASQSVEELISACQKLLDDHALACARRCKPRNVAPAQFNARRIALETISAYRASLKHTAQLNPLNRGAIGIPGIQLPWLRVLS